MRIEQHDLVMGLLSPSKKKECVSKLSLLGWEAGSITFPDIEIIRSSKHFVTFRAATSRRVADTAIGQLMLECCGESILREERKKVSIKMPTN
jgi:hypothetical protein